VADEHAGIRNAVPSLRDWLDDVDGFRTLPGFRAMLTNDQLRELDDADFSRRWTRAIDSAVEQARRVAEVADPDTRP
jgi:hypothetical protein